MKDGDDYIINGGKMWTTNGRQADWMCLLANTSEGPVHANKTLICVPMDTPGITRLSPLKKLGMRSSDTIQTFFEDVRVPQKYRIGREGMGFVYQMEQFQDERLVGAISPCTMLAASLQETALACHQRQLFGKSVLDNQVVHYKLAEIATEVCIPTSAFAFENLSAHHFCTAVNRMGKTCCRLLEVVLQPVIVTVSPLCFSGHAVGLVDLNHICEFFVGMVGGKGPPYPTDLSSIYLSRWSVCAP